MTANDDGSTIDWAEVMARPGALWSVPEVEITQTEPEIPMPAEVEEIAATGAHTELDYYRQETDTMPTFPPRPRTVAVIAQTQNRAAEIADILGIERPFIFGARDGNTFEGLRADRVLIDADSATAIDNRFLQTAHATAMKTPGGQVHFVTVRDFRG